MKPRPNPVFVPVCVLAILLQFGCADSVAEKLDASAAADAIVLCESHLDNDADNNGVADGWGIWLPDPRHRPQLALSTDDKVSGRAAQSVTIGQRPAGVIFVHNVEPGILCRVRLWVKVEKGKAAVQGVAGLGFGWHTIDTQNAGEWTKLQFVFRPARWHGRGGIINIHSSEPGTRYLIDELKIEKIGESVLPAAGPFASAQIGPEKKLINCSSTSPTIAYAREHVEDVEKAPFNGTTLFVDRGFANGFFGRTAVSAGEVAKAIDDLKATKFRKYPIISSGFILFLPALPAMNISTATGLTTHGGGPLPITPAWRPESQRKAD